MLSTDGNTVIAYRVRTHTLHDGSALYSIVLIDADGAEWSVGRMLRTADGARTQRGILLDGLREVSA